MKRLRIAAWKVHYDPSIVLDADYVFETHCFFSLYSTG